MIKSSPRTSVLTLAAVALALTVVAVFALVTASELAQAEEKCLDVEDGLLEGEINPTALSTEGTLKGAGQLNGSTAFQADDFTESAGLNPDKVPSDTISYTGLIELTTKKGTLVLRDVGIFDTDIPGGDGEFTSRARVLKGTDGFEDAEGLLFFFGDTQQDSSFTAEVNGTVCVPG